MADQYSRAHYVYGESLGTAGTSDVTNTTASDYTGYLSNYKIREPGAFHMIGDDAYEPQRTNNFELHIYFPRDGQQLVTIDSSREIGAATAEETLILSTVSVSGLSTSVSTIPISHGNTKIKYAGLPDVGDLTVVYYDFIGKATERILTTWHGQVFNPRSQFIGRKSIYGKKALLVETAPDGSCVRGWDIFGCFPTNLVFGDYNYEDGGETRKITLTLNCDYYIPLDSDSDAFYKFWGQDEANRSMANAWNYYG